MHSPLSDIELWNAFVNGDKESFGLLFRRFHPLLFQYGSKIVPDADVVEDAIQELFMEIWQRPTAQPLQSVKAYLLQALKFKLYKTFRRQRNLSANEDVENIPFVLSAETVHIGKEEEEEKTRRMLAALERLSPRQREIIYLKIYKNLSYTEVGEIMELNYQVVRNLLSAALKAFRKLGPALLFASLILTG